MKKTAKYINIAKRPLRPNTQTQILKLIILINVIRAAPISILNLLRKQRKQVIENYVIIRKYLFNIFLQFWEKGQLNWTEFGSKNDQNLV